MHFHLSYLQYIFLFFSCNNIENSNQKIENIDSVFINWNKATLQSLNNQIGLVHDSSRINTYENRLKAFKAFVGIENENTININSIRYNFLKEIINNNYLQKDLYIIEANRSGEKVEIRNFLFYLDNNGKTNVEVYTFNNGKWIKKDVVKKQTLRLNDNLKNYLTDFGFGFNPYDVTITHFVNNTVIASEYYLYTTLSKASNLQSIL